MAESSSAGVTLGRIASTISVTDMSRALGMYQEVLGMRVVFTNGNPIGFVRIIKGLRDADYGLRGFVFADPDGNRIDVGQALDAG